MGGKRRPIGNFIPDGAPETACGFTVVDLHPERRLLLQSTTQAVCGQLAEVRV